VLLATAVVAAVVIGGIVGFRAWRGDDRGDPAAGAPAAAAPPTSDDAGDDPPGRLFTRVTDAGVEIRVDSGADEAMVMDFGMPMRDGAPGFCTVVDQAMATAISNDEVAQGWLPITQDAPPDPTPVMLGTMFGMGPGPGGGNGLLGVVVQLADDAVSARLTTPAEVDEMAPIDGVAALAVSGAGAADGDDTEDAAGAPFIPGAGQLGDITLTVLYRDGRVRQARGDDLMMGPLVWRGVGECFDAFEPEPPPTFSEEDNPFAVELPPPGEQPSDPAAARAAIDAAMTTLYGAGDDVDVLALVDDPFAMRETFDRLADSVAEPDWSDVAVVIEELVFLSPVEAAFEYTLTAADAAVTRDEQFGRARLVDGAWRIGRGTICHDLQETFATLCPP
jgi:hypothetical protein